SALSMCSAAISDVPTAPMNAMRTEVWRRLGLSLSSSVSRCCNQTASACNRRNPAGTRHPEQGAEKSLLLTAVGSTVPLDRHDRRRAHAKGALGVAFLENDANREALREPHPVERRLDRWQTIDRRAVLLIECPAHPLYVAPEAPIRSGEQEDVGGHARFDM